MTYDEFKAYITRALWREGDTAFEGDLDILIKKAEALINRDLRQFDMTKTALVLSNTNYFPLPEDYVEATAVSMAGDVNAYFAPTTQQRFASLHDQDARGNLFTIIGNTMHVLQPATIVAPITVSLTYYYKAVPYSQEPAEPFYDTAPDFYEAAVRAQCYDYLREFELSAEYNGKYDKLLQSMREDQIRKEFAGGPIDAPLPGIVA